MRPLVVVPLTLFAAVACGTDAAPPSARPTTAVPAAAAAPPPGPSARPAPAGACAAVPSPIAGHAVVELDLDGRGARERLVPTACDADGTCAWAVFTGEAGCAVAMGTILEAGRIEPLPFGVDGVAAVRTLAVSSAYRTETARVWQGGAWTTLFDTKCAPSLARDARWWCEAEHQTRTASGDPAPALPCVTATAPTTAQDLDGDGAAEALVTVLCGDELQATCGTLVLGTRAGCLRPMGFLPPGDVVVPPRRGRRAPAIRVQRPDEAGTQEQIELGVRIEDGAPTGFQVLGTRTCDRDRCDGWTPPDRGAEAP